METTTLDMKVTMTAGGREVEALQMREAMLTLELMAEATVADQ